ncbi:ABC transporter permease subunit [Sodalis glossinidius]|uniref:ABC transporter permease subunit n=1 Tax=Sodalis glossinidius TaxID=63612 RepID=UPI001FB15F58|nr:ABC transporter permease subunit [Sodalis glossinidius]
MLLAIVLGVVIAAMRLVSNPLLAWCSGGYIWFFRGTPVLVQLIFWYNLAAPDHSAAGGVVHYPAHR